MKRTQLKQGTSLIMPLAQPYFRPRRLVREINFHLKVAALACVAVATTPALAFEPVVQLSSLNGSTGFRLDGATLGDRSGASVGAAGDVNGDGIDDLLIGAYRADTNGSNSGASYVVFGRSTALASIINLSSLDGSSGFRLDGETAGDYSGTSVSAAGDINGDGIDDLLIGAYYADPNGIDSGASYVVFGRSTAFASIINLSSLDGSSGFRLDGASEGDHSGRVASAAGDVNGDGIDDLLIGAYRADTNGSSSGSSYVVFGRSTAFASVISLSSLDGSSGFRLDGASAGDRSGRSVSAAGDVNGDGIDDLLIGAYRADSNGINSGSNYVVFGRSTAFAATINLSSLDGSTGFRLDGVAALDRSGYSVSAVSDVNGDGIDDLLIGAFGADHNGDYSGASYVVFGRSTAFASVINLSSLDGSSGFRLDGVSAGDNSGRAVSAAGDVNGDGIDDLLIGAYRADSNGINSGASYVVFGRSTAFASIINLSSLDGSSGFRLDGVSTYDYSGRSVSGAGDVNGDGIDDLLIGAYRADPNGSSSGSSYVVFGAKDIAESFCVPVKTKDGAVAVFCL